jgi:hypothetical protein
MPIITVLKKIHNKSLKIDKKIVIDMESGVYSEKSLLTEALFML